MQPEGRAARSMDLHSTQVVASLVHFPSSCNRFTRYVGGPVLGRGAVSLLHQGTQALECAHRLPVRHAAHERTTCERPKRAQGCVELVAVVKARATIGRRLQHVLGAGVRAGRAASLPHGKLARDTLHQSPVNIDANSSQVDLLIHAIPHVCGIALAVAQLAVNRDPIDQSRRVHHRVPYLLWGRRDLDRSCDHAHTRNLACPGPGCPQALGKSVGRTLACGPAGAGSPRPQRAARGSLLSHSAKACSTAESNECKSTPSNSAGSSPEGSRSELRLSIKGKTNSGRSSAITAATRAAMGVTVTPIPTLGRPSIISSAIRFTISP